MCLELRCEVDEMAGNWVGEYLQGAISYILWEKIHTSHTDCNKKKYNQKHVFLKAFSGYIQYYFFILVETKVKASKKLYLMFIAGLEVEIQVLL